MQTLYTEKQLIEFGNYLLSDERTNKVITSSMEQLEEKLNQVSHADIENFKDNYIIENYVGEDGIEVISILK